MPKKSGYFGVKDTGSKTGNTVKPKTTVNASANVPRPKGPNASGNTFPGMKDGGKP